MSNPPPHGMAPGVHRGGDYRPPRDPVDGETKVLGFSYKSAGVFCYLPLCCCFLGVILSSMWLATEPDDSRFVRFHAIQGLLLAAVALVVAFVFNLLGAGARFTAEVGSGSEAAGIGASILVEIIALLVFLALLALHVVVMIKAGQGEMWKIPVIGGIAERKA